MWYPPRVDCGQEGKPDSSAWATRRKSEELANAKPIRRIILTVVGMNVLLVSGLAFLYIHLPDVLLLEVGGGVVSGWSFLYLWYSLRRAKSGRQTSSGPDPRGFYATVACGSLFVVSACLGTTRIVLEDGWHWYYLALLPVPLGAASLFFWLAWQIRRRAHPAAH